jgi:Fe-S-cluster containining protein
MKKWWQDGIRFECQGSGKCCVSRGQYGYVYLTLKDRRALAKHFLLPTRSFTLKFCEKENGYWKLKGFTSACAFLKNKQCQVYLARPTQCRTWPFWPENMSAKAWDKEVKSYCPGVGKGEIWSAQKIQTQLTIQSQSDKAI